MWDRDATVAGMSDFRFEEEHPRPGTVVLSVHGEIDLHSADELGERLASVVDRGASWLVVDLTGVTFVDSQGLGALLRGTRSFAHTEGRFRLVVPRADVRRIFEITSLDQVFSLDRTREEALAHAPDPGRDDRPRNDV